ncbi:serine protease [Terrihabitans soli]|uniref:Probable periplasmic serine endoprotease DegP-like n=1 Tax=Terrihabitans soli TaxID=708113 RepID=A0A6S6QVV6_9HYPH|nr:Do family serine endopeptidase [Terrihabitans soli]BCJ91382.1 serine protease [Terrihabitans soli]
MSLLSYPFRGRFTALAGGLFLAFALALGPASAQSQSQSPPAPRGPDGIADVIDQVIDSVVLISTAQNVDAGPEDQKAPAPELSPDAPLDQFFDDFFERQQRGENQSRPTGEGSGFVIDAAGTIVTNFHVVDGADRVEVVFNDGTKLAAEVVGKDKEIDVAVLKVKPVGPLKPVAFGDPEKLRVGEWVLAMGNPFGIGLSATSGIVSGRNRDMRTGKYDNFIQTDASINKGNSGGPLFNLAGEVVGVNTAILSPTGGSVGIGFAVPTSAFRPVVAQLLEFGETRRGYIGVRIQDVPEEIAKRLAMKNVQGALIAQTVEKGPADHAGIKKGDVVLSFDGKPVSTSRALQRFVADAGIDRDVEVLIWRDGQEIKTKIRIARLEEPAEPAKPAEEKPAAPPAATGQILGLDVAPLNDDTRSRFKIDPTIDNGVVIVAVRPESPLKDANLRIGETIVEIGQKKVANLEELTQRLAQMKKEGQSSALALIANPAAEMRYLRVPLK